MSGWFGNKNREERKEEKKRKEEEVANQYDDMVTSALERLTHWAFPDSKVERKDYKTWHLWHTASNGQKYVDVSVGLCFLWGRAESFDCDGPGSLQSAEVSREGLDSALRACISSSGGD